MPLQRIRLLPVARAGLSFNGVDQYASVPSFTFPQVFTVILFVKAYPKYSVHNSFEIAFGHPDIGGGTASLTLEDMFFGVFRVFDTNGVEYYVGYDFLYDEGVFTHVVAQYDGSKIRLFKNAVLVGEQSAPSTLRYPANNLLLFGHGGGNQHVNMVASSFLIYSRALSDEEILWNYYYPDNPVRNGLVLWLHWDSIDTANNMWYDKSGFGNHATLYGNPVKEDVLLPPKRVLSPTRTLTPVR